MKPPDLCLSGKPLSLAKRIGKGGEGEVFLIAGNTKKAVKVYTGARDLEREAKVRAIVRSGLARSSSLVAFPEDVVVTRSGEFAGFAMKLVEGHRPVHELYGPKSRKMHFPKADYRFLVRAAANTARALAQVHSQLCVIGDLNHSGILVSNEATIALIDADSFQFQLDDRTYRCRVGVPEFTPPELQGHSLNVVRTKAHDNFGLAVAIFQLLFIGRHPYSGRQIGSDLTLDQLIARNLFAYSKTRTLPVAPPGIVATLDDLSGDVAQAFERAFGLAPEERPTPPEWAGLLQELESHLNRCPSNIMHFYPSAARGCPWCKMESSSGAILFLPPILAAAVASSNVGRFDIEKAWSAIHAITIPNVQDVTPKIPTLPSTPSEQAKTAKSAHSSKMIGGVIAFLAICGFVAVPALALLWILGLGWAWLYFNKVTFDPKPWQSQYNDAERLWDEALERWRGTLAVEPFRLLKSDLEKAITEYRGLGATRAVALARLKTEREDRQRHDYLDRFLIRRASISGVGPAKTMTLASFGIESAADVTSAAITMIPGFGRATAEKLLTWRASHERHFVYNPAPLPADAHAQNALESEFTAKAAALAKRISGGQIEITQIAHGLEARLNAEDSNLSAIAAQRAQIELDLKFLGISTPAKPVARRQSPVAIVPHQPASQPRSASPPISGIKCPQCGSAMVHRVARRGHQRGKQFWGCSRYPKCRGTRN